ncbi:phage tail protein [Vibrio cincinnatiensis]|uniref:phage tail-collar fiber domain-containing protein n=1 Tax=Vibrio cincinnatiensis TaxID=675 RepID=UPI001EE03636|nr:phage tail protein [Vibrio cincinnatiensis]
MANTTEKQILTAAGKALLAQLNAEEKALIIDKMIFANVPNRPEFPQPDDVVPTEYVVRQEQVEQRGRLSADSVIYSTTLTSDVGPFEFNWTGAYCSEYGVLVTIDHHALTPKTADEPGVTGNTLVRSVVLEYKDIAEITNITVDASSWQYNATYRMKKMDNDVAQAIIDQNGKDWFIEDGFLVTPSGSAYKIKAGAGYVSGNRVSMEFDRSVQVANKPAFIYIDAHREGTSIGEQVTLFNFVVTAEEKDDYIDSSTGKDVKHFVCKIAQVFADGSVSDLRSDGERAIREKVAGSPWLAGGSVKDSSSVFTYLENGVPVKYHAPKASSQNIVLMGDKPDSNFEKADKAEHVSYKRSVISEAISQVIKLSIQDKLNVLSSVRDFGAIGDGQSHPVSEIFSGLTAAQIAYPHVTSMNDELDWAAAQACINAGTKLVQFDTNANYIFNKPLKYDPQTTFYAPASGISYSSARSATIKIQRDSWDGSDAIFSKRKRESSYQSIIVDGLSFIGYADIDYSNLSEAEDIGVSAIDISYIRDGAILRNCAFDRLGMAAEQISKIGYLGFCVIDNCHITRCNKALEAFPTTRLTILNTRIYDCYDWVSTNTVLMVNVSFNNSSFSSENCGIHADNIHSLNCWYEGGNRWFDTSNCQFASSIKIEGGFMSEAMSANGSTKLIFKPNWEQKQYIEISGGLKLPKNTRLFSGDLNSPWSNITLKLQGCRHISSNWSLSNSNLESLLYAGLNYEGESNTARDGYIEPYLNSVMKSSPVVFDEIGVTPKLTTAEGITLNVSVDKARSTSPYAVDRNAFVTINVLGNSNGSGGSQIFALQFSLLHGYGSNWTLCEAFSHEGTVVKSLSINGFTISIAAETEKSCQLTIVPTHSGTKSQTNWFVTMKSSNIFLKQV